GRCRLDSHVIGMETSQICKPQSVTGKVDDVRGMIAALSTKVSGNLNLTPTPGAPRKSGDDGKSSTQSGAAAQSPAAKAAVSAEAFAHPQSKPESMKSVKLDVATMKVYSNALDEMD